MPRGGRWREILNSDATMYGGSGQGNLGAVDALPVPMHGRRSSVLLTLPPLAVVMLRHEDADILELTVLGATPLGEGRYGFRVWAPSARASSCACSTPDRVVPLEARTPATSRLDVEAARRRALPLPARRRRRAARPALALAARGRARPVGARRPERVRLERRAASARRRSTSR